MWFEEEQAARRAILGGRRRVLYANIRVGPRRGSRVDRTGVFAMWTALGVVLILAGWLAWRWAEAALFSRNGAYTIANLDVRGGGGLVEYFLQQKGIRKGVNQFAFDINAVRDEFLRQRYASKYKSMEISRILPDALRVEVVERVPLGRVGRAGGLTVDGDGFVFGGEQRQHLPLLAGCGGPALRPGDRLQGAALDAVAVLDVAEKTGLTRDAAITEINVKGEFAGQPDDMRLVVDNETEVLLWWPRRQLDAAAAQEDLRKRLLCLRAYLLRARREGRRLRTLNLTLESYEANCPATFYP
jgi:hypothetical protein